MKINTVNELTKTAMASIDGIYWQKCINKMKKEAVYYLIQDGVLEGETAAKAKTEVDETLEFPPEIPVRFCFDIFKVLWFIFRYFCVFKHNYF